MWESFLVEKQLPFGWKDVLECFFSAFYWILNDEFNEMFRRRRCSSAHEYQSGGRLRFIEVSFVSEQRQKLWNWNKEQWEGNTWFHPSMIALPFSWRATLTFLTFRHRTCCDRYARWQRRCIFVIRHRTKFLAVSINQWSRNISMVISCYHGNHSRLLT